jgi:hypothetical protein
MRFLRPLVAAGVLCLVLLACWLGQWRYFQYSREIVRVNRFSGNAFRLTDEGWERMQPPSAAEEYRRAAEEYRRKYPDRPAMDTAMNMDTTPPKVAH